MAPSKNYYSSYPIDKQSHNQIDTYIFTMKIINLYRLEDLLSYSSLQESPSLFDLKLLLGRKDILNSHGNYIIAI